MGIGSEATAELDILVGHPEHDLLFIATQVARAAGLKDPSASIRNTKKAIKEGHHYLSSLLDKNSISLPKEPNGYSLRTTTVMFTEDTTYQMLLRGHAPASEPFRKWVTEEVLPSIRKTGSYNVNESTSETGQKFAGELAELHAIITGFQEAVMARFGHLGPLLVTLLREIWEFRRGLALQISRRSVL